MGVTIGMPSLKLNNAGNKSKSCGSFIDVAKEGLDRHGRDKDIDAERSHLNEYIGFQSAEELTAYSKRHIEEMNEKLRADGKRGIRNDAVVMCATIIKPPAHWINAMSEERQKQFCHDAIEGIKTIIPPENIKSIAVHADEQGRHVHVFWEPMTEDGRLCAKECHNLKFFGRLNREMPSFLREKGWEIDDCKAYDAVEEQKIREELGEEEYASYKQEQRRNRGVESIKFKAEAEQVREELEEDIIKAECELFGVQNAIDVEADRFEYFKDKQEKELESLDKTIAVKTAEIERLDNEISAKSTKLRGLINMITQAEKYYNVVCDGLKACDDLGDLISFVKNLAHVLKDKDAVKMADRSEEKRISLRDRMQEADKIFREQVKPVKHHKRPKEHGLNR